MSCQPSHAEWPSRPERQDPKQCMPEVVQQSRDTARVYLTPQELQACAERTDLTEAQEATGAAAKAEVKAARAAHQVKRSD